MYKSYGQFHNPLSIDQCRNTNKQPTVQKRGASECENHCQHEKFKKFESKKKLKN